MAIKILAKFDFPSFIATVFFNDVTLEISEINVNNLGDNVRTINVYKLTPPPKKTFSQIFNPGVNINYSFPKGFNLTVELNAEGEYDITSTYLMEVI